MEVCERPNTLRNIQQLLAEDLGIDITGLDPTLPLDQLGIDSLAFTECLFKIEDKFGISMADSEITIHSLLDVANIVHELVAQKRESEAASS